MFSYTTIHINIRSYMDVKMSPTSNYNHIMM